MRYEVLTGQEAEDARLAGAKLQKYNGGGDWVDEDAEKARKGMAKPRWWKDEKGWWRDRLTDDPITENGILYRIKPQPKTIRKPLPDLRALAGSMLVDQEGEFCVIKAIRPDGKRLLTINDAVFTQQDLVGWAYHYAIGGVVRPCWTEEVEG